MISEAFESATRASSLDSAVHRAWVHDALAGAEPLGCDPPARAVLAQAGDEVRARQHALTLHAQDVDDVGVGDRSDVVGCRRKSLRQKRRRTDEHRARADEAQSLDERPRNT